MLAYGVHVGGAGEAESVRVCVRACVRVCVCSSSVCCRVRMYMILSLTDFNYFKFSDIDECSANPCGSHECVNKLGGFECICTGGFTGSLCDIPPDFCNAESCLNGATCITGQSNYTCSCPHGFHGTHCEMQASKYTSVLKV